MISISCISRHSINVDRREKNIAGGWKLGEFFFNDLQYLYQSLHIPCLPQYVFCSALGSPQPFAVNPGHTRHTNFREVDKWLSRGAFSIQPKPIGELSTELLDMIFEAVLDDMKRGSTKNFLPCICLAISCKRLLCVGKRHVLRALILQHARAADCRIVCLGGNSRKDDQAPPGMLTDAEIKEVQTTRLPDESDEPTDEDLDARCLSIFAGELYDDYAKVVRRQNESIFALENHISRARKKLLNAKPEGEDCKPRVAALARDLDMVRTLAGYYGHHAEYPPGPNVLCNLSKGECVREAALVRLESNSGRLVSLAHAVLSRICYSSDSGVNILCSEEAEERLAKGPWAGDRFRITSEGDMPLLAEGTQTEWKDVTEDVNTMLRDLWSADESSDDEDGSEDGNEDEDEDEHGGK